MTSFMLSACIDLRACSNCAGALDVEMTGRRPLSVACPRRDAGAIRKVVEVVAMTR
jgi:hypothetical protein